MADQLQSLGDALLAEAEYCVRTGRCTRALVDRTLALSEAVGGSALGILRNYLEQARLNLGLDASEVAPWVS